MSLTNPADHNVTVAYHLVNGTAVAGSDFSDAGTGTVTILAGQTSANITVNVTQRQRVRVAGGVHGQARQRHL